MILINEWLPNPAGRDGAENEWIELANTGSETVSLRGYKLAADSGKGFIFSNQTIPANGYLVVARKLTKITLKNSAGSLSLWDTAGAKIQTASFVGDAPEGKSVNRTSDRFAFGEPSPGAVNIAPQTAMMQNAFPAGPLHASSFGIFSAIGASLGVALALSVLAVILIKRSHDLSELFFSRY